jgi:hypothetical protein
VSCDYVVMCTYQNEHIHMGRVSEKILLREGDLLILGHHVTSERR